MAADNGDRYDFDFKSSNLSNGAHSFTLTGDKFDHGREDISVAYMAMAREEAIRYTAIPYGSLMTADEEKVVQLGEDVFMVSVLAEHVNTKGIYPVMHFGRVSMTPNEDFVVPKNEPFFPSFLVHAQTGGGSSGSPVFLLPEGITEKSSVRDGLLVNGPKVLGMLYAACGVDTPVIWKEPGHPDAMISTLAGHAVLTPASRVRAFIDGPYRSVLDQVEMQQT